MPDTVDARWRNALVYALSVLAAVYLGTLIAQGELGLTLLVTAGLLLLAMEFSGRILPEASVTAFLLLGYIVGSRGFAQIMPFSGLPLLPGELGLATAGSLVLVRGALQRRLPVERDRINLLILLWIALGVARLPWDIRTHGFLAVRDLATVYYALFFFIGQAIARDRNSRRIVRGTIAVAFALLAVVAPLFKFFTDFFLFELTFRQVPLIFHKDDLLATWLFAGFVFLLPARRISTPADWVKLALALGLLALGLAELSRASMVGLIGAIGLLGLGGNWRPLHWLAGLCGACLAGLVLIGLFSPQDFKQSKAYAVYEHVLSLTDFSGTRRYENEESIDSGGNNRYRLVWWKNVTVDTLENSPVLGLGFGYDLTRGFLKEYYPGRDADFNVRSPHSIIFTVLGRMGLVGLAVWAALLAGMARECLRLARQPAPHDPELSLYAICWLILLSAFFGVMLEGPMGAIPFWTLLGVVHQRVRDLAQPGEAVAPKRAETSSPA